MAVVKWPRFYCWVPLKYKERVQTKGIDWCSIKLYTSKDSIERELKGRFNRILLSIDTSKINHSMVISKDFYNWFYRGKVPSSAITIIREKGRDDGRRKKSSVFQRGRLV